MNVVIIYAFNVFIIFFLLYRYPSLLLSYNCFLSLIKFIYNTIFHQKDLLLFIFTIIVDTFFICLIWKIFLLIKYKDIFKSTHY